MWGVGRQAALGSCAMIDDHSSRDDLLRELIATRAQLAQLTAAQSPSSLSALSHEPSLATLLANSPDTITVLDLEARLVYVNRTVAGRTTHEILGTRSADYMPSQDRALFLAAFERVLRTGEPQRLDLSSVSGYVWETRLVPLKHEGSVFAVMGIGADITARRRAEAALRESEEKLRVAMSATGLGLWRLDWKLRELSWDAATSRMLGVGDSACTQTLAQFETLLHPDDRERVHGALLQFAAAGTYEDLEHRVVTPTGAVRTLLSKGSPLRGPDGELLGWSGGMFDITERKRLEEQLRQSQKMEALGQLTAGIAHNFNNMLTVILSNVLLCEPRVSDVLRPRLRDAEQAARRAADMVRQLMVFARRYPAATKLPIDVRDVVHRTADICRTTFDKNIEICVDVPDGVVAVLADPGQLEQVLLNICLNARDALDGHETACPMISLRVDRVAVGATERSEVRIRIKDNGPGMSAELKNRVFEPFFTTKEVGRGTGLGLATAYGSIIDHGGQIDCESTPGAGATFTVRLPCVDAQPQRPANRSDTAASSSSRPAPRSKNGQPTILLIEDELMVRKTTSALLASGGYDVIEAADGEEGLALYERELSRIDLVMLDWSMPRLSGQAVLERLVRRSPEIKVILFSGHYPSGKLQANVRAIIQKPSPVDSVLGTIRAALDA